MKRQGIGIRRSTEEAKVTEDNQLNDSKRLKVTHNPEPLGSELETGSGSDTTDEYMNSNGQDNITLKHSTSLEAPSLHDSSENHLHPSDNMNGYSQNGEQSVSNESSSYYANGTLPVLDNMSGSHTNGSTSDPLQGKDYSMSSSLHGNAYRYVAFSETYNDSHWESDLSTTDKNLPILDDMSENEANESVSDFEESRKTDAVPLPQLSIQTECIPYNENDTSGSQETIHDEKMQEHDAKLSCNAYPTLERSSPEDLEDKLKTSKDIPSPIPDNASSSLEGAIPQAAEVTSPLSQPNVDIENITLCQLKVRQLSGHADVIFSVAADEDFILSSSGDTTVKVWNVEDQKEISNFAGHNAAVTSVILLNPEQSEILRSKLNCFQTSRIAVSASYDCHIRLWSVLDAQEILSMYTFNSITCMDYLQNLMYVVVGTEGGKLEVWDLHAAKLVHFVYAHDSAVSSLKVQDCYVYSTSKDGAVKVWLFDDGELQPLYTRRRKEASASISDFGPTQWQTVAVHNDMLFLGDSTSHVKTLDWRIGRLRLFSNQPDKNGICEAVLAKNNILLTSFFDFSTDTGGVNVWRLPEMTYVGTLTGDLQEICSLALVHQGEKLRIVSGGHQLLVWDFDFSKPPKKLSEDPFFVCEVDKIGSEVNEELIEAALPRKSLPPEAAENKKSWCTLS